MNINLPVRSLEIYSLKSGSTAYQKIHNSLANVGCEDVLLVVESLAGRSNRVHAHINSPTLRQLL